MTQRAFVALNVAVLTISDTRTMDTDKSGPLVMSKLEAMGHRIASHRIVKDDTEAIREAVGTLMGEPEVSVVIATGGTGITRRDITPEAIAPLATKHIPGFGELFRFLSYQEIGTAAILSRADAWLCDETLVFLLPGSTGAVTMAMDKILSEQLDVRHRPCSFAQLMPRFRRG